MRILVIIFLVSLYGCSPKSKPQIDIELLDIWITWDDWQGVYWIDSVEFRSDWISVSQDFAVDFFLAGEYLEADLHKVKLDSSNSKLIITYLKRPNFRNTNFASKNPIFNIEAGTQLTDIYNFIHKNVTYSLKIGTYKVVKKSFPKKVKINVETRLKYIFID